MAADSVDRQLPNPVTRRRVLALAGLAGAGLGVAACADDGPDSASGSDGSAGGTFYWISHGAPSDQIWALANDGATAAGEDLSVSVRTSFHQNDVASQKEAFASAIAARPAGIATSIPQPGVLTDVIQQAMAAGIPVVTLNSDEPETGRVAYVGADLTQAGVTWATYLLDNGLVGSGDKVWLPVEAAGASYQVLETTGINSIFEPNGITAEVFQAGGDPAESLAAMQDYLTANGDGIGAIIGLGDLVMSNIQRAFDAVGWEPGRVPVVGWGNEKATADAVKAGYVNAATWQYPDSQGYLPIVLLRMLSRDLAAGYDIATTALYTADTVADYEKYLK